MKDFFDRKTFDPVNNETDRSTLNVLRTQGRIRRAKYDEGENAPSTAMKWALGLEKSGTFLDLGCGDSPDALIALSLGFTDAHGLDLFPPEQQTELFMQTDVVEKIPFADNSVDVVVSQAMLDLIEPNMRERFFREVRRVMRPDGVFACYLQWLQSGYGFDLEEELLRAEEVFGKIERKPQGFIALKYELEEK